MQRNRAPRSTSAGTCVTNQNWLQYDMNDYRILSVYRLTGVPPDTIRKWEQRYGVVSPRRDARGVRRYSDTDVRRLRALRHVTELGYPISEAAALKPRELAKLLEARWPAGKPIRHTKGKRADSLVRAAMQGLERYDAEQIDRMLNAASHLLAPHEFVFDVMSPAFHEIGEAWSRGTLAIAQEHLFSAVARSVLGSLLKRYAGVNDASAILLTTPPGEPHEFGILLAAMLAASEGHRVHYLGPSVPARAIAQAARDTKAAIVVLGSARREIKSLSGTLAALDDALPRATQLWLGGKSISSRRRPNLDRHLVALPSLPEFYDRLRNGRLSSKTTGDFA